MNAFELEMRQTYLSYLPVPLEQSTIGQGFKAMLEYYRDHKFTWVTEDELIFNIDVEIIPEEKTGGFLGFFQQIKPSQITGFKVSIQRMISDNESREEGIILEWFYAAALFTEQYLLQIDGTWEYLSNYSTLEEYVKTILENDCFQEIALLPAARVMLSTDNDYI